MAKVGGGLGAVMVLPACGGGGGSSTGAPVSVLTTEIAPEALKALDQSIAEFSDAHPKWSITRVQGGTSSSRGEDLIRRLQTGQEIGVFELQDDFREGWVQAGYLEPLDDVLEELGADRFISGTTFKSALDNKVYGLPLQINPILTWIRTDLFQKAGLTEPEDLDELIEVARALTKGNQYGSGLALGPNAATTSTFFPVVQQAGTDYFDKEGNLIFDDPRTLEAIEKFAALLRTAPPGAASWGYTEQQKAYMTGNIAIGRLSGQFCTELVDKSDLAKVTKVLEREPFGGALNGKTSWGRWTQLAISKNTRNMPAAKEFLKYLVTDKPLERWITATPGKVSPVAEINERLINGNSEVTRKYGRFIKPYYDLAPVAITPGSNMGSVIDGEFKKTGIVCPWASKIWGDKPIDVAMLQRIVLQNRPAKQEMQKAVKQMSAIADEWKRSHPKWHPTAT